MKLIDDHLLVNGPYMMGECFTLADIPVGLVVNRWFSLSELERPAYRAHGRNGLP